MTDGWLLLWEGDKHSLKRQVEASMVTKKNMLGRRRDVIHPVAVSFQMIRNPMQNEGCCGVLKALQANPGTGVEILDLPVSVTPERRGRGGKKFHVQCVNDKVLAEGF